ncbi:hypothetical protein C8R46DRAFT_1211412 [Mycena filopes]|nr:hypothetical protein C8R46DRAFT_1211412 [Mycena filopes]
MNPENLILRRRLAYVESQLETESLSNPRVQEERQRRLTEERIAIQESLDSIVYPILTIPCEITVEIFVNCLPGRPNSPSGRVAPMLLGRICRQWRIIACSTPRLWAALRAVFYNPIRPRFRALLCEWLRRARAGPAYLDLTLLYPFRGSDSFLETSPFTAHWAHLTSFRGINFTVAQCCPSGHISLPPASELLLPSLEHLQLNSGADPDPRFSFLDSLASPALQSLKLGVVRNLPAIIFRSFLERAPNLQNLEVSLQGNSELTRDVLDTLAAMRNLTTLGFTADTTLLFEILRLLAQSPTSLPHVQHTIAMSWHTLQWTDARIQVLIDAVTSRSDPGPGVAQLVAFEFSCDYMVPTVLDDRISACISELKGKGMRIHIGRVQL